MTYEEALQIYRRFCHVNGLDDRIAAMKYAGLRKFFVWCTERGIGLEALTAADVVTFLYWLQERAKTKATVKAARTMLVELLSLLHRKNLLAVNPLEGLKITLQYRPVFEVQLRKKEPLGKSEKKEVERYRDYAEKTGMGAESFKRKERDLKLYLGWCAETGKSGAKTDPSQIEEYLTVCREQGASYSTLRSARRAITELLFAQGKGDVFEKVFVALPKAEEYRPKVESVKDKRALSERERELLRAFDESLQLKRVRTHDSYLADVREFFDWCAACGQEIDGVTESMIEDYRNGFLVDEKKMNRITINNKLNAVKMFYRFLIRRGKIISDPFEEFRGLKIGKTLPRNILSVEETGTLLSSLPDKKPVDLLVKSVVYLLYGCALRISEVLTLQFSDLELTGGYLTITEWKNDGKRRRVPVPEMAMRWLKRYLETARPVLMGDDERNAGYVFPQQGRYAGNQLVNRHMTKQARLLGFRHVTSHCFRHCAATHLLRNGAGIRDVQAYLGHEYISSTQVYTRIVKEDLKAFIAVYHPREIDRTADEAGEEHENTDV